MGNFYFWLYMILTFLYSEKKGEPYKQQLTMFVQPRPGVGNLFMLEGRINLAVIK
jgi:hypothetical protein